MTAHNLSFEAIMEMSPEELAKLNPSELLRMEQDSNDNQPNDVQDNVEQVSQAVSHESEEQRDEDENDGQPNDNNQEGSQEGNEGESDDQTFEKDGNDAEDQKDDDNDQSNDDADPKVEKEKETEQGAISQEEAAKYKTFFETVTAEFKAIGTTFTIQDPKDIVSLMQKGLHYNQKMAAIKPYHALIETMKEHGLTDAASLGFLIDLKNKKPEAIAKLIQESGVDTYELDQDKANSYTPTEVDLSPQRSEIAAIEQEYEADQDFPVILGEIKGMDENSRVYIFNNPSVIRMLMDHKKNGYFDQIMPKVKQAIAMGNAYGSVLEIYDQVGRAMFAGQPQNQGEAQAQQPQVQPQQAHQQHQQQQQARQDKQRLEAARKAASMTPKQKQADKPSASNITEEDIFNMSAEELAKVNPKFLLKGK